VALTFGLVVYTGAFIAEVVRAGIMAVSKGQTEAARAQGFTNGQILRLIVLPQALRVIIPPLISQYLNLTKNSSLALGIGFLDLYAVSSTMLNQSGRVVEVFLMIMASYLTMSLTISLIMNVVNRRIQIVER
jgi:general L-amino acid transport system permease protein